MRARRSSRKIADRRKPKQTTIWCHEPADVPARIDQMLRAGELRPEDIHTCVYWAESDAPLGTYERHLAQLDLNRRGKQPPCQTTPC